MSTVRVYGPHGEALNPCHPARARQLLRNRRATVVSKRPYACWRSLKIEHFSAVLLIEN
jgi:hypothetical protein